MPKGEAQLNLPETAPWWSRPVQGVWNSSYNGTAGCWNSRTPLPEAMETFMVLASFSREEWNSNQQHGLLRALLELPPLVLSKPLILLLLLPHHWFPQHSFDHGAERAWQTAIVTVST